ncbi:MAG TPA: hypothetical protein VGG22_08260 [Candidatus Baltobacteraceae bacterium]|jgi:hypothetical protein
MDHPENEPKQDEVEHLQRSEEEVALEDLDIPDDLKSELLRELDGFKEGDDARRRGERPPGRA